jgi:hypothetical protein
MSEHSILSTFRLPKHYALDEDTEEVKIEILDYGMDRTVTFKDLKNNQKFTSQIPEEGNDIELYSDSYKYILQSKYTQQIFQELKKKNQKTGSVQSNSTKQKKGLQSKDLIFEAVREIKKGGSEIKTVKLQILEYTSNNDFLCKDLENEAEFKASLKNMEPMWGGSYFHLTSNVFYEEKIYQYHALNANAPNLEDLKQSNLQPLTLFNFYELFVAPDELYEIDKFDCKCISEYDEIDYQATVKYPLRHSYRGQKLEIEFFGIENKKIPWARENGTYGYNNITNTYAVSFDNEPDNVYHIPAKNMKKIRAWNSKPIAKICVRCAIQP